MKLTRPATPAADDLRERFQAPLPAADPPDELVRDLSDYDRAFGLVDGEEVA